MTKLKIKKCVLEIMDSLYNRKGFDDWCHYSDLPSPMSYMSKEEWVEEPDPIMDEFDMSLKMLHESTHDEKIRESILLVQRYKTEYLDNPKQI